MVSDTPLNDELWMEEALRCAQRALDMGEVPVGAVVVCEGKVVGRGWNRNIADADPTAHAEMVALREAGATVGNHRLGECELFVTIEPCPMCSGALVHARIKRRGNVWTVADAGTSSGTLLNGQVLAGPTPLHSGDRIQVGQSVLSFVARA